MFDFPAGVCYNTPKKNIRQILREGDTMDELTDRQRQLCDYLLICAQEGNTHPTIREIADALGLKSPSTVHFHLEGLRRVGLVTQADGKSRTIALTERGLALLRRQVPVVGNVAAGSPIWAEECVEDYLPLDVGPHPEEYFALRVRGESMLGAGILPGDLVVVHRQQDARNGEIVVALFEDEATVKTLKRKDGKVWLLPENPAYNPIDGTFAQLLGKVTAVLRWY